jgi:predicted Zn-dependent protease
VGIDGQLRWRGECLVIEAETAHEPAFPDLSFREIGFGNSGVEIGWRDDAGEWVVHVLAPADAQALLSVPALARLPGVQTLRSRQERLQQGRALGWTILAALLATPFLLLTLFLLQADRLAEWITQQIPIEQEMRFGHQAFESMRDSLSLNDNGPAHAAVQELGQRLSAGSNYRYEFHVAVDPTLNAFAMPGGIVVVNSGLIEATKRPEELAGVLAHELQHVEQRHSLRGLVKQMGLRALWTVATGDFGSTMAAQAALHLTELKFSRDAESEADSQGFATLVRTGIDPSGMPAFFHTMSEHMTDAGVSYLSTHPLNVEREQQLSAELAQLGQRTFVPLPTNGWPPR